MTSLMTSSNEMGAIASSSHLVQWNVVCQGCGRSYRYSAQELYLLGINRVPLVESPLNIVNDKPHGIEFIANS